MPCYHPLLRIPLFFDGENKLQYRVISYDENKANKIYKINHPDQGVIEAKAMPIGCGQCIGCRLDYSQQWATRCMLELPYHKSSYFVTLTYDDSHVPYGGHVDDDGEFHPNGSLSLSKRDFQLFMKRLRKRFPDQKIRYFAAGEYGGKTMRPHYHAIIFGLELDDLKLYKKNELGQNVYTSETFQRCWSVPYTDDVYEPLGFAVVADVSWESCAYVARYIMKKQKGKDSSIYSDLGIVPEFTLMSRKPGIAYQYFIDHPEIYKYDQINIPTLKGGRKVKPPRYYDKIFDLEDPERMKEVKENRKDVAEAIAAAKMAQTSLPYLEMLAVEEANRKAKVKVLRRKEC